MNLSLFNFIYSFAHHSPLLDSFGVFLAEYFPYLMLLAVLVLIALEKGKRRWAFLIEAAMAVLLSRGIITSAFRFFYHHPRPFDALHFTPMIPESSWSFPSGHAAFYFALAGIVFYYRRNWGILLIILSLLNGVARIFVGVHWPFDIVGGAIVGLASAWLVHRISTRTSRQGVV